MSNKNVTKIERLSSGMVKLYNRSNVIGAFSALNSISIGYENNNARTIQFTDNGNTISFQLFNLQEIIGSTTSVTYTPIDTTSTGPDYNARIFEVFDFLSSEVFQGFSPGPTYVGGVVAAYPNFASFPVTGTKSVIYIDEADNSAYYWDGTIYQLLVSTGVEQYANFALFPVTGAANVIYIDMSVPEPYVWNGTTYESMGGGTAVWGGITGTLSAQTDLQAALDAKFDDPTGTTSQYIRGDGSLATFPTITSGTVTSVGTTGLISGGPITSSGTITTSMATNKLVGRSTAGTGIMEEITIGSGLTLTGAGILNNTATPTPIGYYGAFQDSTRQIAAAINTPYAVKLNTTDLSNGITIVNNGSGDPTRITIANTGVYNIQFSLQLEKSGGSGNMTADIWLRENGVDIPSTTGKVVLTGSASASPIIAAWNYVLDVVGGNYYELMWAVSNIHVEIFAEVATPPHPATPSAILTVTQQAGIMAGTGVTAINSLTGAVQTLATGTTGTDFAISSTGTTHTFNLPTASAANRGALSSTDWSTFNGKQDSLGYTPLAGVHSIMPMVSGSTTFNGITPNITTATGSGLTVRVAPYIPAQSFTTSSLFINVSTATAGSLCTIVIYSDVNGVPTNLLYESADLDCSTIGLKIATTSFNFVAGTIYWLGLKSNTILSTRFHLTTSSALPLSMLNANSIVSYQRSSITYSSPSPSPLAGSLNTGTGPAIYMIKA